MHAIIFYFESELQTLFYIDIGSSATNIAEDMLCPNNDCANFVLCDGSI